MNEFKTITEYEILKMAWDALLDKWLKALDREEALKAEGKEHPIATAQANKYHAQMEEIHKQILKIEANKKTA